MDIKNTRKGTLGSQEVRMGEAVVGWTCSQMRRGSSRYWKPFSALSATLFYVIHAFMMQSALSLL